MAVLPLQPPKRGVFQRNRESKSRLSGPAVIRHRGYLDAHPGKLDALAEVHREALVAEELICKRCEVAAFRAYYEHMPLRRASVPHGPDMQLYRRVDWGRLATFHVLDTRRYRSALTCGDPSCDGVRNDPRRTITGDEQEHWLLQGLADSPATWQLLAQQVIFTYFDRQAGPGTEFSGGDWNAYVGSRKRVIDGMVERHVRNPVVLTVRT